MTFNKLSTLPQKTGLSLLHIKICRKNRLCKGSESADPAQKTEAFKAKTILGIWLFSFVGHNLSFLFSIFYV
jgi:hypothetical protein